MSGTLENELTCALAFNRITDCIGALIIARSEFHNPFDPELAKLEAAENAFWKELKVLVEKQLNRSKKEYEIISEELKNASESLGATIEAINRATDKIKNATKLITFLTKVRGMLVPTG